MGRDLLGSLELIRSAAEEIRREQWCWQDLREAQKLRWRSSTGFQPPPSHLPDISSSGTGQ